eukprot:scaffold222517_cov36-Tisochrysis_lutea.AAC.1
MRSSIFTEAELVHYVASRARVPGTCVSSRVTDEDRVFLHQDAGVVKSYTVFFAHSVEIV